MLISIDILEIDKKEEILKKILLMTVLLSLTTAAVFANRMIIFTQGTYMQTGRTYTDSYGDLELDFSAVGIKSTIYIGPDKGLGFYFSGTLIFPIDLSEVEYGETITNESIDTTYELLRFGIDGLTGAGFLVPLTPKFSLLAAGGFHLNSIYLISFDNDPYLSLTAGPAVTLK